MYFLFPCFKDIIVSYFSVFPGYNSYSIENYEIVRGTCPNTRRNTLKQIVQGASEQVQVLQQMCRLLSDEDRGSNKIFHSVQSMSVFFGRKMMEHVVLLMFRRLLCCFSVGKWWFCRCFVEILWIMFDKCKNETRISNMSQMSKEKRAPACLGWITGMKSYLVMWGLYGTMISYYKESL